MAATLTSLDAALKETWTSDRLEEQLYQDNPFLEEIEKTDKYTVGAQAVTPLHTGRNGGYTALPAAGGTLNTAGEQKLAQAIWNYTHHHVQVKIQGSAIDGTKDNSVSVAQAVDVETTGALNDLRRQLTRQSVTNGDSIIAGVRTKAANAVIDLNVVDGTNALERGWLYPGLFVDIGTTAAETSLINGEAILAVSASPATATITVTTAVATTAGTHFVSVKDARSGTTSYEMNGLKNIAGSETAILGGINPATEAQWKPSVDSTTTSLTLPALYNRSRAVQQGTGMTPDYVLTGLLQAQRMYELVQMQVRFSGDSNLGAGNVGNFKFAGMSINAHPDVKNEELYMLTKKALFIVTSGKPFWQNSVTGGKTLDWIQGEDAYGGKVTYRLNLATNRRNAHAAFTALT